MRLLLDIGLRRISIKRVAVPPTDEQLWAEVLAANKTLGPSQKYAHWDSLRVDDLLGRGHTRTFDQIAADDKLVAEARLVWKSLRAA